MISGRRARAYHSAADSAFGTGDNLISHNNLSRSSRGAQLSDWMEGHKSCLDRGDTGNDTPLTPSPLRQSVSACKQDDSEARGSRRLTSILPYFNHFKIRFPEQCLSSVLSKPACLAPCLQPPVKTVGRFFPHRWVFWFFLHTKQSKKRCERKMD